MLNLARDLLAAGIGFISAFIWTWLFVLLVQRNVVSSSASRKLIHVSTAPLFALTFPFYSNESTARFMAAAVPGAFAVRLYLGGYGVTKDPITDAVARQKSKADEATGGPFWYAVSVACIVALAWRERVSTYLAISMLAFGDGSAELGAFYPMTLWPLPNNWKKKSVGGSVIFLACGSISSYLLTNLFAYLGQCAYVPFVLCFATALVCSVAEVLPVEDNILVPAVAIITVEVLLAPAR